jgi:hypothetical protein
MRHELLVFHNTAAARYTHAKQFAEKIAKADA